MLGIIYIDARLHKTEPKSVEEKSPNSFWVNEGKFFLSTKCQNCIKFHPVQCESNMLFAIADKLCQRSFVFMILNVKSHIDFLSFAA